MAKSKICSKAIDVEHGVVTFTFADDRTIQFDLESLTEELFARAALHGLSQKGGDSYAGAESVDEAFDAVQVVYETLYGETPAWSAGRESTGGIWVEALAQHLGCAIAEAKVQWDAVGEDKKKNLKANKQLAAIVATINLARKQAAADKAAAAGGDDIADILAK